jgi:hypothetical protein
MTTPSLWADFNYQESVAIWLKSAKDEAHMLILS